MDSSLFDYHLPTECIAQEPSAQRDASRLMVIDRRTRSVTHAQFADIGTFLPPNARFFRNNAAVLKARLFGQRPTGGKVECLLLQPAEDAVTWWCLLKPGKKTLSAGEFGIPGEYRAEVLEAGQNGNCRASAAWRSLRAAIVGAVLRGGRGSGGAGTQGPVGGLRWLRAGRDCRW